MWEVLHYPLTSFKSRDRPKARNTTVLIVAQFSLKLKAPGVQRNNIQIAHALPSCMNVVNCLGVPLLVNPRRACARVTVVVLCVCLSVCLFPLWLLQRPLKPETNDTHWFLFGAPRVTVVVLCVCLFPLWLLQRPLKLETNDTHWFLLGFSYFRKKLPFKSYGVKKPICK